MTGMSWLSFELVGKRLELLKEAVPRVSRVAILSNPQHPGEQRELWETQSSARAMGMTLDYDQARTSAEFDAAYDAIRKQNFNGLPVFPEAITLAIDWGSLTSLPSADFRPCSAGKSMWKPGAHVLWAEP